MYIWRGKNRRDRRDFLLDGPLLWGPRKQDVDTDKQDDLLRHESEAEHMKFFHDKTRRVMFDYLLTPEGQEEIRLVAIEIDRVDAQYKRKQKLAQEKAAANAAAAIKDGKLTLEDVAEMAQFDPDAQEKERKKTVYEVFRKYDVDGSDSIDVFEMRKLLNEIKMKLTDEEFVALFKSLDTDGGGEIDFEEFYGWFKSQTDNQKSKSAWGYLKGVLFGNFYDNIKQLILETEARNLLFDCAVARAEISAQKEFRIAHPPKHICEHCNRCFLSLKELSFHNGKDNRQEHVDFDKQTKEDERRFKYVDNVFIGSKGRKMFSNRLLFSPELGLTDVRIQSSKLAPYRPMLADPDSKRKKQMLNGLLVQGANPSAGVRAKFRQNGLVNQYKAPGRLPSQPRLENLFVELMHCMDSNIDIVIAPGAGRPAEVRFQWNGYAYNNIEIMGEFNGWIAEEMQRDFSTGKRYLVKALGAGRYRYKFVIDGVEMLDEECSKVDDNGGRESHGMCNLIVVINPLLKKSAFDEHVDSMHNPNHQSFREGTGILEGNSSMASSSLSVASTKSGTSQMNPFNNFLSDNVLLHEAGLSTTSQQGSKHVVLDKLQHINLRNVCLFDDGCWALSSFLRNARGIISLDLSFNGISDDGMRAITLAVPYIISLEVLKLNGNGFGIDGCRYISGALRTSNTLKHLELSKNNICDDGAECISEFIKHHASIEKLYLDSCHIGDGGAHFIGEGIVRNKSLLIVSIAHNLFQSFGAVRLATALLCNSIIKEFYVHNNHLGADGGKAFGDMLFENNSLQVLDLSYVDIVSGKSGFAIHSICASMKRNKALRVLKLKSNNLKDDLILEIANALQDNRGLVDLDLTGNEVSKQWFLPDLHLHTHISNRMPTIRTSLDRNASILSDPEIGFRYVPKPPVMDPAFDGEWTDKQKWKQINHKMEKRRAIAKSTVEEEVRIKAEKEFVAKELAPVMKYYDHALNDQHSLTFLSLVGKLITAHYQNIVKVIADEEEEEGGEANRGTSLGTVSSNETEVLRVNNTPLLRSRSGTPIADSIPAEKVNASETIKAVNNSRLLSPVTTSALEKLQSEDLTTIKPSNRKGSRRKGIVVDEDIKLTHRAIMSIIFKELQAHPNSMALNPEKLEQAFHYFCLPLHSKDVQSAVDATLVREKDAIGFYRFCKYSLAEAHRLAKRNTVQRLRLLADLFFSPPLAEAKQMILDNIEYKVKLKITKEYRTIPGREPLYVCYYCGLRFVSERKFKFHKAKGYYGYEHKRFRMLEAIQAAQGHVLRKAKFNMTGSNFPTYYELVPETDLPRDYAPQVFDKMGSEGRPIGAIEPKRCVRVEDMLGEFINIAYEGGIGWVRYRIGPRVKIMHPACSTDPTFSWSNLKVNYKPVYYRVKQDLPNDVSLKVRFMPLLGGDVCGHLNSGQIVECWGELGDWIQIRYGKEDCAWVLCVSGSGSTLGTYIPPPPPPQLKGAAKNKILIDKSDELKIPPGPRLLVEKMHPSLQLKLFHMNIKSPGILPDDELVIDEDYVAHHHADGNESDLGFDESDADIDRLGELFEMDKAVLVGEENHQTLNTTATNREARGKMK